MIDGKALVITPRQEDYDRLIANLARFYDMSRKDVRDHVIRVGEIKDVRGYKEPVVWLYANWYEDDTCRDLVAWCEEADIPISGPPVKEYMSRV